MSNRPAGADNLPELPRVKARRVPRPGRTAAALVVLLLGVAFAYSVATNPRFGWDVVAEYIFSPMIVIGALHTLEITFLGMSLAIILSVILAIMQRSSNVIVERASALYIWFFRGTPMLVQLLFWFNFAYLYPRIVLRVPFGPEMASLDTNILITTLSAAVIGLGLHEAAYMAEVIRGGIAGVPEGQLKAATSLGMSNLQTLRRILLPQAMRAIIPPSGNQVISMLKYSSLASVIGYNELLQSAETILNRTFETIPLLITASIWYVAMVTVFSWFQRRLERHFARGFTGSPRSSKASSRMRWETFRDLLREVPFGSKSRRSAR